MSSFWLILKQQWTIKISSPLFSIFSLVAILVGSRHHRTNFGRGPSKDHSTKVWFKLALWLQRSWLKCEKLTDGRSVVTIAKNTISIVFHLTQPELEPRIYRRRAHQPLHHQSITCLKYLEWLHENVWLLHIQLGWIYLVW